MEACDFLFFFESALHPLIGFVGKQKSPSFYVCVCVCVCAHSVGRSVDVGGEGRPPFPTKTRIGATQSRSGQIATPQNVKDRLLCLEEKKKKGSYMLPTECQSSHFSTSIIMGSFLVGSSPFPVETSNFFFFSTPLFSGKRTNL